MVYTTPSEHMWPTPRYAAPRISFCRNMTRGRLRRNVCFSHYCNVGTLRRHVCRLIVVPPAVTMVDRLRVVNGQRSNGNGQRSNGQDVHKVSISPTQTHVPPRARIPLCRPSAIAINDGRCWCPPCNRATLISLPTARS